MLLFLENIFAKFLAKCFKIHIKQHVFLTCNKNAFNILKSKSYFRVNDKKRF